MGILKRASKGILGRRFRQSKQTRPWSIQIELTEGCNRLCTFCGLNAIRDGKIGDPWKFMTVDAAKRIAHQISLFCPDVRLEFAMHGEPTLNPNFFEIISIFRGYLPKTQMLLTTNGRFWMRNLEEECSKAFAAGLDMIALDTYEPERLKLQEKAMACTAFTVVDFYASGMADNNPMYPWMNHKRKVQNVMFVLDDIGLRTGESKSRGLLNHAGNAAHTDKRVPALDKPMRAKCALPFREVSICYDGNINICCMDWGHEYTCGNILDRTLQDIWFGAEFEAARTFLFHSNRGFSPCDRCNAGVGSRAGLLTQMPKPTQKHIDVIEEVHRKPQKNKLERKIWPSMLRLVKKTAKG